MPNIIKNNKVLGGVIWGIGGTAGQAVFQLIVFVILARKLSPETFGVVAIATSLIDLLNYVGRCGISEVLIQRNTLTKRSLNSGFFASLISGGTLTLILFFSAPGFASIFRTPQLFYVIEVLSPICVLYALGAVYEGSMRHAYLFKQLALRNTSATLVSGIAAILMALYDYGVYALVAQRLIGTVWTLIAMVIATKWVPSFDIDRGDIWAQLKQGSAIAFSSVLGAGNQRLVDLVVGYFLGAAQLGYLRIAWRMLDLLLELAVRPINSVSLTSLSKAKHDGRGVNNEYISLLHYSSIFVIPMFLGFSAISTDIVTLIFGDKWLVSAQVLSILCLMGFFYPIIYFKSNVLIAHSKYKHVVILNVIEFIVSIVTVLIFAPFGLISATIGNVLRTVVATPIILTYLKTVIALSPWKSIQATLPAVGAGTGLLIAAYTIKWTIPEILPAYGRIGISILVGASIYFGLLILFDRGLLAKIRQIRASKAPIEK